MKAVSLILAFSLLLGSCTYVTSILHEGDVVAQVGAHRLYSSDLDAYIPRGLSPEDSIGLAKQYISSWAVEQLYDDTAKKELSKEDQDVSKELDDYRRSLLKYRYEQTYINQRLDTTIAASEIESYYDSHQEQLKLTLPIVRARYVTVMKGSPNLAKVKKQLSVEDEDGMVAVDSVLLMSTLRNTNFGGQWVEAPVLAREFGIDYSEMLSSVSNGYIERLDEDENRRVAYIYQIIQPGKTGPVEFYKEKIKDIILSARKQALLSSLERELLEKARAQGNYVTF